MVANPPSDTLLRPLSAQARPLSQYLGMFHLAIVVIDPFTVESAWLLETATRILDTFSGADCSVSLLVAANARDTAEFLGPYAGQFLTFIDPDREFIKALDLGELPAIVHIAMDASVVDSAEGWHPSDWSRVTDSLARMVDWKAPNIPGPHDPAPFPGSPALG